MRWLASLGFMVWAATCAAQPVLPLTQASVPITITTAATTQLVAGVVGKGIYVTALSVIAAGTGNIQFIYGSGATCGTGTANLTGNYNLTAQAGLVLGNGGGIVLVVPSSLTVGNALCAVTSAGVGMPGSLAYAQF
jgi:hypothetical protein